jgi:hypothetical protein
MYLEVIKIVLSCNPEDFTLRQKMVEQRYETCATDEGNNFSI